MPPTVGCVAPTPVVDGTPALRPSCCIALHSQAIKATGADSASRVHAPRQSLTSARPRWSGTRGYRCRTTCPPAVVQSTNYGSGTKQSTGRQRWQRTSRRHITARTKSLFAHSASNLSRDRLVSNDASSLYSGFEALRPICVGRDGLPPSVACSFATRATC
jgi:hypothetical protein